MEKPEHTALGFRAAGVRAEIHAAEAKGRNLELLPQDWSATEKGEEFQPKSRVAMLEESELRRS
jgi:hypothetical protein